MVHELRDLIDGCQINCSQSNNNIIFSAPTKNKLLNVLYFII